jgi:hypothetical protein
MKESQSLPADKGIVFFLKSDGGFRTMAGIDPRFFWKRIQLLPNGICKNIEVSTRKVCSPNGLPEKNIPCPNLA